MYNNISPWVRYSQGDFFMRKIIIFLLVVCCLAIYINKDSDREIRVRVIPNSDSSNDLVIKNEVKDCTIVYLRELYSSNYDEYLSNINTTMNGFEGLLENTFNTKVSIKLGYHTLYNKTYNNNAVENTKEMTLLVIIGEGKGSNWWGTIYPEFLEVDSDEEFKYESLIVSILNNFKGE